MPAFHSLSRAWALARSRRNRIGQPVRNTAPVREGRIFAELTFAINDSALCQVVRRQLDPDFVARHDPDEVFPHSSSHMRHDFRSRLQLDTESRIGEGLRDGPFDLKSFFFFSQLQPHPSFIVARRSVLPTRGHRCQYGCPGHDECQSQRPRGDVRAGRGWHHEKQGLLSKNAALRKQGDFRSVYDQLAGYGVAWTGVIARTGEDVTRKICKLRLTFAELDATSGTTKAGLFPFLHS